MGSSWPSFDELGADGSTPPGSSWGVFGDGDQKGTINFLGPESVNRAAGLVNRGQVFNLDYPVNHFTPYWSGTRGQAEHVMFSTSPHHHDDYLDNFYLQSTTQIDGLRHIGDPVHGFYGGRSQVELETDEPDLGIQHWANSGIVGRGVLLDVARQLALEGRPIEPASTYAVTTADLEMTAERQGVHFERGDILLIRTGWASHYLALDHDQRTDFNARFASPGLAHTVDTVRWLWDRQVALAAADNVGLEAYPVSPENSEYYDESEIRADRGSDHRGMLHRPLIALLGLAVGELWALDELAEDCAQDSVYEFMVVCKPLNLIGGAGSPANAVAIK